MFSKSFKICIRFIESKRVLTIECRVQDIWVTLFEKRDLEFKTGSQTSNTGLSESWLSEIFVSFGLSRNYHLIGCKLHH